MTIVPLSNLNAISALYENHFALHKLKAIRKSLRALISDNEPTSVTSVKENLTTIRNSKPRANRKKKQVKNFNNKRRRKRGKLNEIFLLNRASVGGIYNVEV
ncbi:hypothetical protein PV328_000044 [Microctonus aethiopoides]|uniref:Uncharacterized protein n=1 Tax=Microctonus aethiopoides TaxID=144406 RepID=A0AA39FUE3_9HYME|nr:hypothetical protein PV328_000044 [Microctonus aethiopoides]